MDIKKIIKAVNDEEMHSALRTIYYEMRKQGYDVKIEEVEVMPEDIDSDIFIELEQYARDITIEINKKNEVNKKYNLTFAGYHKFKLEQI